MLFIKIVNDVSFIKRSQLDLDVVSFIKRSQLDLHIVSFIKRSQLDLDSVIHKKVTIRSRYRVEKGHN